MTWPTQRSHWRYRQAANLLHELAISISTRFENFFTYTSYCTRGCTFTHIAVRVCPYCLSAQPVNKQGLRSLPQPIVCAWKPVGSQLEGRR